MIEAIVVALSTTIFGLGAWIIKQNYNSNQKTEIQTKLEFHFLFTHIQNKISWLENEFYYPDKGREILVKTVLIEQLKIWHKLFKELNKEVDECYSNCKSGNIGVCTKLYDRNMKYYNQAIKGYKNFYENDNFSENEKKLLRIFMVQFMKYFNPELNRVRKWIYRATHSSFFNDCKSTQASINNEWVSVVDSTLLDAEETIASLNGSVTGYKINGVVIGNHVEKIK